jgi:hypothetical protein
MYGFVKSPGKNDPFPVRHYEATGVHHAEPQVNEHGITTTRPGVKLDEVVAWWGRKGERDAAKAKEKAEKAAAKKAKEAEAAAKKAAEGSTAAPAASSESSSDDGMEDVGAMEDAE